MTPGLRRGQRRQARGSGRAPGKQLFAPSAVRIEIARVIDCVEGFVIVIHVQMVSHNVGAVLFVHAGGLGAGVVKPIREQVLAAVGTGQVGKRWLGRGGGYDVCGRRLVLLWGCGVEVRQPRRGVRVRPSR